MRRLPLALLLLVAAACSDAAPTEPRADASAAADAATSGAIDAASSAHADAAATAPDGAAPAEDAALFTGDAGTPFPNYGTTPGPTPGLCFPGAGQTGNDKNVGAYCTPNGQQCQAYAFASICSIDVDPMGDNFCIHIGCRAHDTCGQQGCCTGRAGSVVHACVPKGCLQDDMAADCPPIP